ncbi:MAG: helix-turn-helix domain-containing protein [Promethearchaeota archaeon]
MSLKEHTKEIFSRYGLNDSEIKVLLAYLGLSQATCSLISEFLKIEYEEVKTITEKLVQEGFLKEIKTKEGHLPNRYLPLEPYFSLYIKESSGFREEIEKIKDAVLQDQSKRFKELENIKNKSVSEVDGAVDNQVSNFFKVSDEHDTDKKAVINNTKDRFTNTTKTLESQIHEIIDRNYSELNSDVNQMDNNATKVMDDSSISLNQITDTHIAQTEQLESKIHQLINNLNQQLKNISDGFIDKTENRKNEAKAGINKIISDLLKDFALRSKNLETEMKKDLDSHVETHKENAQELTPALEEILAKYMSRMHDTVEELKRDISKLLFTHIDHIVATTDTMRGDLQEKIDSRQNKLIGQIKSFEDNTVVLIDNLIDISSKLTNLSKLLSKRGSAFKALFLGKHKDWVSLNEDIQEKISKLSSSTKSDFIGSTSEYIENTNSTKDSMKNEITSILSDEHSHLKGETDELDNKAQQTVNAELEGLAGELSTKIDATLQKNVQHCRETTVKLKDSIESSFSTHKNDFDAAINRHLNNSLSYYDDYDKDTKTTMNGYYSDINFEHNKIKSDTSAQKSQHIADIKKHAELFENIKEDTKKKHNEIFNGRLAKIRGDFDNGKNETSEKINSENSLFTNECSEIDTKLHNLLEDHKSKYKDNANMLQQSLTNTVNENNQNLKDAIADFTLNFMNNIDEANEIATSNEEKLTDIFTSSSNIIEVPESSTWHIVGMPAIIEYINDALTRVKSSIIVVSHEVIPKVLETMSKMAYERKSGRFFMTTHWSPEYEPILSKMKSLGNIQFRQMKSAGSFLAMTRDAEEVLLAPVVGDQESIKAVVSTQEGFCKLYSQIIGPVFQANSRPI